jgi:hypothetical protein
LFQYQELEIWTSGESERLEALAVKWQVCPVRRLAHWRSKLHAEQQLQYYLWHLSARQMVSEYLFAVDVCHLSFRLAEIEPLSRNLDDYLTFDRARSLQLFDDLNMSVVRRLHPAEW